MLNHPYICLDVDQPLQDPELLCWMSCVKNHGPSGILAPIEPTPNGSFVEFYRRKSSNKNHYIAVLSRNLTNEEATVISKNFSDMYPTGDFMIRWSQDPIENNKHVEVAENAIKAIALDAAKFNHNRWWKQKINEGWRYGQKYDRFNRISPVCQDWDMLPKTYQLTEYQRMLSLLDVLEKMNLKIVEQ